MKKKWKLKLNEKEMRSYLEAFDPVEFKYKGILDGLSVSDKDELYCKLQEYEEAQQFESLVRKDFENLKANLDMIYSDRDMTDYALDMYYMASDKLVQRYVNIDGIGRLFNEKYTEFEWDMHMGINYKTHSMTFSRDHFIHQLKDAVSMAILLERGGFYKKVKKLLEGDNSKISQFVEKMLCQQMSIPRNPNIFPEWVKEEQMKEHYLYNIIYMTSYMAGLFHDIGYPATAGMQEQRKMINYIIETQYFGEGQYDFNKITMLLQNTLLFLLVPPAEIRRRIEGDNVDHGVISALIFLLHFYENGAVQRLEPYKLCAVELAGLSIYNHTNHYRYSGEENPDYERCVFLSNPPSYLLRVCDDLQEWGRIYFEVSDQSNLILCEECGMPIMRRQDKQNKKKYYYECGCMEKDVLFSPIFEYKQFPCRRVYNVSVCGELDISWSGRSRDEQFWDYDLYLDYKLGKLLHVAYLNEGYARHRTKELAIAKKLFPEQKELGMVSLNYFVTANIILIKSMIVAEYFQNGGRKRHVWEEITENLSRCLIRVCQSTDLFHEWQYRVDILEKEYVFKLYSDKNEIEKTYYKKAFKTYIFIGLLISVGRKINTENAPDKEECYKKIKE